MLLPLAAIFFGKGCTNAFFPNCASNSVIISYLYAYFRLLVFLLDGLVLHGLLQALHQRLQLVVHPLPVVVDHERPHGQHRHDQDDQQPVRHRLPGGRGGRTLGCGVGVALQLADVDDAPPGDVLGVTVETSGRFRSFVGLLKEGHAVCDCLMAL